MVSARSFVILISCAVLSVASLICAQDVKPSETRAILQRPPVIQELELQRQRFLGFSLQADPVSTPLIYAQDLSRYREFQFGMSLPAIAKHAGLEPSQAKVIHQRPALIQELNWRSEVHLHSSQPDPPMANLLHLF